MENLLKMDYSGSNVLVYVKLKESAKFEALASLKTFEIAPTLMYAALYPVEKLDRLKEYLAIVAEHDTVNTFQIRSAKDRKTVLFQIN